MTAIRDSNRTWIVVFAYEDIALAYAV